MLVAPAADRPDVVAVRPEFAAPEFLLDPGSELKDTARCGALYEADDLTSRVLRQKATEQMDMVLIKADRVDVNGESFLESAHRRHDQFLDRFVEQGFAVFDGDLDVVKAFRNVVVPVPDAVLVFDVWPHAYALYRIAGHSSLRGAQGVLAYVFKN